MIAMWGPRARGWQVRPCEWTQPVREHRAREQVGGGTGGGEGGVLAFNGAQRKTEAVQCSFCSSRQERSKCDMPCAAHMGHMGSGLWKQSLLSPCGSHHGLYLGYVVPSLQPDAGVRVLIL